MFRSGTTTMARALNAHPDIAFASDPFLPFFKKLRSNLSQELGHRIPVSDPLSDYYFSEHGLDLLTAISDADPERPFSPGDFAEIAESVRQCCVQYSASLTPYLDNLRGATYRDYLRSMLEQIDACYGGGSRAISGFKEVWATEFVPFFLRADASAKAVIMMRDPRAVCASKNSTSENYPWTFLCRQWRKLAVIAKWCETQMPDRVMVIRLEDLVREPEPETRRLSDFLGVDWHPDLADPSSYRDGGGAPYKQNTSYEGGAARFNTGTLEKWRQKLAPETVEFIDYICGPEMGLYGYAVDKASPDRVDDFVSNPPLIDDEAMAKWIRPFASNAPEAVSRELKQEALRDRLMSDGLPSDSRDARLAFLHPEVFSRDQRGSD